MKIKFFNKNINIGTNVNPTGVTKMRLGVQRSVPVANPCWQGTFCHVSRFFLKFYCGSFFLLVEALHLRPGIKHTMINSPSQLRWHHRYWQAIKTWQHMCAIVIRDHRSLWEFTRNPHHNGQINYQHECLEYISIIESYALSFLNDIFQCRELSFIKLWVYV